MSEDQYVVDTLQLPQQIPLFKYNVNFAGLKKLLSQQNIQTNNNSQSINKIFSQLKTKYATEEFKAHQKILNNSIKLGINAQKFIDQQENKFMQIKIDSKQQKTQSEEFAYKLSKLNEIIDFLLLKSSEHQEQIDSKDRKKENLIQESFKRLQDKIDSSLSTFNKTINNYFNESNKNSVALQSNFNMLKLTHDNKFKQMQDLMTNKVNNSGLQTALESFKHKIIKEMEAQISTDQMKRMSLVEDYSNQLKQLQKSLDLENKVIKQKVAEVAEKVKNSLGTKAFQMQKHKIYQKLSQFKMKTDQLSKKNGEFIEFRKNYLGQKEKIKQEIVGLQDQIKKLKNQESSFKKMENVSDLLGKLDPHLVCQIANQVKLHEKEIGKLEKNLMDLQVLAKDINGKSVQTPQVNAGQNSDLIQKIIKQYMGNIDFEGRLKKVERDFHETSKRADGFYELQKKINILSKDLDVSALMKQLKRKCDQQYTKKEFKIVDTKVESLFEFFKTIRKEIDILYKRTAINSVKENPDNPSLTGKKLIAPNCISCIPSTTKRRAFSKQRMDYSLDESQDYLKSTTFQKYK